MIRKFVLPVVLLVIIFISGCGSRSIKSANFQAQPEIILGEGSEEAIESIENPETDCSTINPHPVAQGMEETFDITYEEVMILYCDGFAFSDILIALETSELVDQSPEALLARLRTRTWQEIWDEFGVSPE